MAANEEIRRLVAPLSIEDQRDLEERVLAEKHHESLVVWNGTLLSCYNRYDVYVKRGLPYEVVSLGVPDRESAKAWVLDKNYGRLTRAQRSYLLEITFRNTLRASWGGDQRSEGILSRNETRRKAAQQVARRYGVARPTIYLDERYANACDRLEELVGNGIRQRILLQDLTWSKDVVIALAELDEAQVKRIVKAALKTGTRPQLPEEGPGKDIVLRVPRDNPEKPLKVLERKLTPQEMDRFLAAACALQEKRAAIGRNGQTANGTGSFNPEPPATANGSPRTVPAPKTGKRKKC